MIEAECPKCLSYEFITTAHVQEEWLVDSNGKYIENYEHVHVLRPPDPGNIWYCAKCHTEAVVKEI